MRYIYVVLLYFIFSIVTAYDVKAQHIENMLLRPIAIAPFNAVNSDFYKGVSLYSKQQYVASIMVLERMLLDNNPSHTNRSVAEFIKAISGAKMMKSNSLNIMEEYVKSSDNPTLRYNAMIVVATILMEINDFKGASEVISAIRLKSLTKENVILYNFVKGFLELKADNLDAAYVDFSKCTGEDSAKRDVALYYMAYIDYVNGDLDKAVSIFEMLSSNANYIETNLYILQIRFMQGNFELVVEQGKEVLKMNLKADLINEVTRLIGESYFNLGNYIESVKYIEKYQSYGGNITRELYYQIGYCYYMQKMYDKAIKQFSKILEGDDALAQNAYYHLADAYLKVGDKMGAMQAFSMAASFPFEEKMSEDALYNYARLTYESKASNLYTKKIDVLNKYINLYPKGKRANELRSYLLSLYLNGSNFDAAMKELIKVKNPSTEIELAVQRLSYQKATEYFNDGDYDMAISLFNKSLDYNISPKYIALSSFWKAESMFKKEIYSQEVIELYRNYLRAAQPSMTEYKMAHYNIGYVYFNNKQWPQSIESFERFTHYYSAKDEYLQDAYLRLADAMFVQKDYKQAQVYYKKSSSIPVLNRDYTDFQIALSEGLMGRDDLKIATLKSIVNKRKSSLVDQATIELASTYIKAGKFNDGVDVLENMISRKSGSPLMPVALLELGVAYVNGGNENKAIEKYKKLVALYPQSSQTQDALLAIKAIYVGKGDVEPYFAYIESLGKGDGVDAGERESLSYDALQRQYLSKNYKKVIELATSYESKFPKGLHFIDVSYYLTESLIKTKNKLALAKVESLLNLPSNQYTITTLHNAAKLYDQKGDNNRQYQSFLKIYQISVNASEKKNVLENLMILSVKMEDKKFMEKSWDIVFADKDASPRATDFAYFARGKALYEKNDFKNAITDLRKVKLPISRAEAVQAKFLLADALYRINDIDGSEKVVVELSSAETPHQYWVARAFILYGEIYTIRGDLFQAKATYQSILEGYEKDNDGIKKRVEKLVKVLPTLDVKKVDNDQVK